MRARGSRGLILRLALRAIRWRAAASATVFLVAVVAILAATVGPVYLHAVDQAVLTRHLRDATLSQRDVVVTRESEIGYPGVDWDAQVRALAGEVAGAHLFARALPEEEVDVDDTGADTFKTELASVGGLCAHVRIVSGRCVSGRETDATVISTRIAAAEHLTVGDTLMSSTSTGRSIRLRVAGIYRPVAPYGPFWQPWNLFRFGQPAAMNEPPPGDAAFVTAAALQSRLRHVAVTFSASVGVRPGAVGYGDIGRLRGTVARVDAAAARLAAAASTSGVPAATVTTSLPLLLDQAGVETTLARTLVTVATAQLALLAILLLYAVVANTARVQGPEVALAKLRGRRSGSVLLQSVAQPVVLVLAAGPVGAVLAWILVRLLGPSLLGRSVPVTFPAGAYGVAALGVAAGGLAAALAARRILVTPVGDLMRLGAAPTGSGIGLLVADGAAVTIAVAGLVELDVGGVLDSGTPNPLAVLAPTLLAVAAAIVVLRLLPFLARRLTRWTRDSRRVATFLAVRQLLRRPAEARPVLLVAVAVSIAAFAVATWADSRHNRELRALNSAGAHTVLVVRPGAGAEDLRTAVDRADPNGQAMAVAYTNVAFDGLPPLIAVDTARFAAVGAWVAGNSPIPLSSVLHRLGSRPPPVIATGTGLRLRVDLIAHPRRPVRLSVGLAEPDHTQVTRTISPVTPGTGAYDISLPGACAGGCPVTTLDLTADTPYGSTRVSEIRADLGASIRSHGRWTPLSAFADPGRWRGNGRGQETVGAGGGSLSVLVRQSSGLAPWPSVVSAAIPTTVPAAIGSAQAKLYEGDDIHDIEAVGLDGQALFVDGQIRTLTLPEVDRDGIMVDLGTALAAMDNPASTTTMTQYQVWLSPTAPSDIVARLARRHVYVERTIHSTAFRPALDDSGPAFADSLFLLSALAAAILAIAATAVGRVLSVRRRGYERAALEAVGVPRRTLRRATIAEQGGVFGIGLVVGLAAGLVGSRLALPSTPVFVDTSTGPPLVFGLPWGLLAALAAGMVVAYVIVSTAVGRMVERAATPGELRGAQQ